MGKTSNRPHRKAPGKGVKIPKLKKDYDKMSWKVQHRGKSWNKWAVPKKSV